MVTKDVLAAPCHLLAARAGLFHPIRFSCVTAPPMPLLTHIHFLTLLIAAFVANDALINVTVDDAGIDPLTGLGFSYSPLFD